MKTYAFLEAIEKMRVGETMRLVAGWFLSDKPWTIKDGRLYLDGVPTAACFNDCASGIWAAYPRPEKFDATKIKYGDPFWKDIGDGKCKKYLYVGEIPHAVSGESSFVGVHIDTQRVEKFLHCFDKELYGTSPEA